MSSDLLADLAMTDPDEGSAAAVRERAGVVLRPRGALARLDELAVWLAGWQRTSHPAVQRPSVVVFAADHGVVAEDVSAYPQSVTGSMVGAIRAGVATVSVMAGQLGVGMEVVDVGVGRPTGNLRSEPAMSREELGLAFEAGRRAVAGLSHPDLLVLGEVGIGNTTSAAAVCLALFGGDATDWVGPGAGLDGPGLARKREVVAQAVGRVTATEPLEILRQLGGRELAAIAGAAAEARARSIPVILDGMVTTAAAMPLEVTRPGYLDHCWPGHVSAEPGHRRLVELLGRPAILDLEMRLGEGSGALAALPIVALAARCVTDVATFDEWDLA